MKKDSIQTRKRKPKGQGKSKSAKQRPIKSSTERETLNNLKVSTPGSSNSEVFPTDLSIPNGSSISISPLNEKQLSNTDCKGADNDVKTFTSSPVTYSDTGIYINSSPDSNNHSTNHIRHSSEGSGESQSTDSIRFGSADACSHPQNLLNSKATDISGDLGERFGAYSEYNSNQKNKNDLTTSETPMVGEAIKANFAEGQNYTLSRYTNRTEPSAENVSYNGLSTAVCMNGAASAGPLRDDRRHFSRYYPYANYNEHRSSFVKSEPAVN